MDAYTFDPNRPFTGLANYDVTGVKGQHDTMAVCMIVVPVSESTWFFKTKPVITYMYFLVSKKVAYL